MRIDHSRWTAFYANPELYRLIYEQNLAPRIMPDALAAGIIMHEMNEARNLGHVYENSAKERQGQRVNLTAAQKGAAYFAAFKKRWDGDRSVELVHDDGRALVEVEFELPLDAHIPGGSPHSIVGRMDEVVRYNGELWVGDTKTANEKSTEVKKRIEFGFSMQPVFYINAARMLGYPVGGMLYRVVTAHTPAKHWVIESRRSPYQLSSGLYHIHQTATLIEDFRAKFGIDEPWPHLHSQYPCNYINPRTQELQCEYRDICKRPNYELTEDDLDGFVRRMEHLDVMKTKETK